MEPITIPLSKQKLYFLFAGCVLFVAISIILLVAVALGKLEHQNINALVAAMLGLVFFSAVGLLIARKLFSKTPGIVISAEGILENSSGSPAGFIPWTDIVGFDHHRFRNQELLTVIVKNPEFYIQRQRGFIARKFMQLNYKIYGTPISITANGLNCNFGVLMQQIEQAYLRAQQPTP